jgi:hypothetical protein
MVKPHRGADLFLECPERAAKQTLLATYDKAKVATRLAINVTTPDISPVEARKSRLLMLI